MNTSKFMLLPLLSLLAGFTPINPGGPIGPINPGKPDLGLDEWVINTSKMGPYVKNQKDIVHVYIKNETNKNEAVEFFMNIDTKVEGIKPYMNKQNLWAISKSSIQIDVPITNAYLTELGLTYNLFVFNEGRTKTFVKASITYYPFKKVSINVNELTSKKVEVKPYMAQLINSKSFAFKNEIFDFTNTITIFEEATYFYFDLSKLKIRYSDNFLPPAESMTLKINDQFNLFPFLANNKVISLPLKVNITKEKDLYFSFANQLFVNPNSLEMSNKESAGFIPTNKFYLPRNGAKQFNSYKFTINLINFGRNKTDFTYTLGYYYNKNLIGDCADSDFCVIGGVSND